MFAQMVIGGGFINTLGMLIILIVGIGIVCWVLSKVEIPPPINYVVYGGLALLALWALAWFAGMAR